MYPTETQGPSHGKKDFEAAMTGMVGESPQHNLASDMLKMGKTAPDSLMRSRIASEDDLLSWLEYKMCIKRYGMDISFDEKADLYIAGLVGVDGVGRKEAVQMVTGVLHHALYDEKTAKMKKWRPWSIKGSDGKEEEQGQ